MDTRRHSLISISTTPLFRLIISHSNKLTEPLLVILHPTEWICVYDAPRENVISLRRNCPAHGRPCNPVSRLPCMLHVVSTTGVADTISVILIKPRLDYSTVTATIQLGTRTWLRHDARRKIGDRRWCDDQAWRATGQGALVTATRSHCIWLLSVQCTINQW